MKKSYIMPAPHELSATGFSPAVAGGSHCGPSGPFELWANITGNNTERVGKVTIFRCNLSHRDIQLKHLTFT